MDRYAAPADEKSGDLGVVAALAVLEALDELRDQEIQIRVALAMAVRRQVHGHAVDERREVRAVIEVEAAQEHLIRFPAAAVLRHDETRHGLEDLARAQARPRFELGVRRRRLATRSG